MKKKYRYQEVTEYAEKIKDRYNTRKDLIVALGKKFGLSFPTIGSYLQMGKFSKRYSRGLNKYWNEVRSGKKERPKFIFPDVSLAAIRKLQERPRLSDELTEQEQRAYQGTLRKYGIVKRYRRKRWAIYFLPHQKLEAYKMIKKRQVEVTVTATFLTTLGLIFFYGFKYFAGFKYASSFDQMIINILGIILIICVIYFVYRFLEWIVRAIKRC